MKKFDLNNSSNLSRFKEEFNKILESRISKAKLNEELSSLKSLPLGSIVDVFQGIADKLYEAKGGKKLIAKYVKTIRENKCLSNAYSTYEIVRNAPNVTNPQLFLSEALSMSKGISKQEYTQAKAKLADVVCECVKKTGVDVDVIINSKKGGELNESVEYLLLNEKRFSNLPQYVNKFDTVCKALNEGMKHPVSEGENLTGKELIGKLNEEISSLKDWESDALKDISLALLSESSMSELFENYKNKCLEKLDEAIEESDSVETTSHFESMKAQLSEKQYKKDTIYEDIFTLAELAKTLTE